MAYFLKSVTGPEQRMELGHLREALKNGSVQSHWLVRDERQDFWYGVGELLGTTATPPMTLFCPKCRQPIRTRRIDIGLPVACGPCKIELVVPDPDLVEQRLQDNRELVAARNEAVVGTVLLLAGGAITILSFFWREKGGGWLIWYGPVGAGLVMCLWSVPRYFALKKKMEGPMNARGRKV